MLLSLDGARATQSLRCGLNPGDEHALTLLALGKSAEAQAVTIDGDWESFECLYSDSEGNHNVDNFSVQ